jgi:membrane-associated phospholipid phosphatase
MTMWTAITSLGDSAILLPLIAWIAVCLLLPPPYWRDGRRWLIAVALCGGSVVLSKLLFMAWGIGPPGLNYTGFSGHTALALLVWPSLAGVLARDARSPVRTTAVALGVLIGVGVGISRCVLKVHSQSEVWLGGILGAAVVAWFLAGLARSGKVPQNRNIWRLAMLVVGAIAIGWGCYGRVFPSQHLLQDIVPWLSGHPTIFTRRVQLD